MNLILMQFLSIVFFIQSSRLVKFFFLLLLNDSLDGSYKSNVWMFAQMEMSSMISLVCLLIKIWDFYS